MRHVLSICLLLSGLCGSLRAAEPQADFRQDVQPLFAKYCDRCHNDKKASADLNLRKLNPDLIKGPDADAP